MDQLDLTFDVLMRAFLVAHWNYYWVDQITLNSGLDSARINAS